MSWVNRPGTRSPHGLLTQTLYILLDTDRQRAATSHWSRHAYWPTCPHLERPVGPTNRVIPLLRQRRTGKSNNRIRLI